MKKHPIASALILVISVVGLSACGSNKKRTPTPTPAPAPAPTPTPQPVETDYQVMLDNAVGDALPAVAVSISGPEIDFVGAAGLADIETQSPMQTYSLMPAGSAGKKATALLVATLHNEGLIDIDNLISTWLPQSLLSQIPHSDAMTLRQLMNHTAGVHDYLDDDTAGEWFESGIANISELKTDIDALQFILNKPAYFEPGQGYQYSNTGYLLAGLIMDEVLGEHHHSALRTRILNELGMNTSYYNGIEKDLGDIISGYTLFDDDIENTREFYDNVGVADAPLASTVSELTTLMEAIVSDDSPLDDAVREMIVGQDAWIDTNLANPQFAQYSMGMFRGNIGGFDVYHHGGDEAGYKTEQLYFVELDTTVTLFANCNGYDECRNSVNALMASILTEVTQQN